MLPFGSKVKIQLIKLYIHKPSAFSSQNKLSAVNIILVIEVEQCMNLFSYR